MAELKADQGKLPVAGEKRCDQFRIVGVPLTSLRMQAGAARNNAFVSPNASSPTQTRPSLRLQWSRASPATAI
jgi:hypothetical protein